MTAMITCPWCGTNYAAFQSNCKNCGGPLPAPEEAATPARAANLAEAPVQMPPPAPRPISSSYAWRLLLTDGWAIAALVFVILGAVFMPTGLAMTVAIVTAFVGIPFVLLGLLFLGGGAAIVYWRYQEAAKLVAVLRDGEAVAGVITGAEANYSVRVNGRHPWVIRYQFRVAGRDYQGRVSTLNVPGPALQPGRRACVLYFPDSPDHNSLYPHP